MGLSGAFILRMSRALGFYSELLNKVRIARGKPRIEPNKVVLYMLKTSTAPVLGLLLTSYIASQSLCSPSFFYFSIPTSIFVLFLLPLASEYLSYASYIRKLREDVAYFMVLEGISPGDDLLRDLEEESESACLFLPSLCNEYSRLKLFNRFFPGVRGIKEYVLRAPRPMRKLLLEYIVARENASFATWVYSKFQEALRDLKTSAKNSLELKTILSLTAIIFNGLTPPLVALVAALGDAEVKYAYSIVAVPAVTLAVSESMAPRLLKISVRSKRFRYLVAIAVLPFLAIPLVGVKNSVVLLGFTLLCLGAVVTTRFTSAYLAVMSLPSQLIDLANRIPYSRRPAELIEESLGSLRSYSVFSSLCYHMLLRSVRQGSVDTARIVAFKDIVEELFSLVKQSTIVRALVVVTALFQPLISSFSMSLATTVNLASAGSEISIFCLISSIFYSITATLAAFGIPENTVLVGLVLLELYALGVTP